MQDKEDLNERTKTYAIRVMKLVDSLPQGRTAEAISKQLLHSANFSGRPLSFGMPSQLNRRFYRQDENRRGRRQRMSLLVRTTCRKWISHRKKLTSLMEESIALAVIMPSSINTARQSTA